MANYLSIARPYALAAFETARDKQQLSEWKAFLDAAALIAKDPAVVKLLQNPELFQSGKLVDLFENILSPLLDAERKNFLLLLAQNRRFLALPDIADTFRAFLAAFEKVSTVRVVTAIEIDDAYREKLKQSLIKRTKHDVTLKTEVDPAILGGAIIHIGDRVIDGSIRGKLTRLRESLSD